MATRSISTWRTTRFVGMPACAEGLESGVLSALPTVPAQSLIVDGFRRNDAQYQGKPAHLVGVPSS